jgi:predicted small integral membrane protein
MDKTPNNPLDLDDLKSLWQNQLEDNAANDPFFNNQKILEIMQEKSTAAVKLIRRNILIEILITIPLIIGAYFLLEARNIHLSLVAWIGIIVLTFGYHAFLLWKLQHQAVPTESVNTTIKKQHADISGFIRMYDLVAVIGGLTFCFASGFLSYNNDRADLFILSVTAIGSLSSGYGCYIFVRWYIRKLYGQHYAILEDSKKVLEQA